MACTYVKEFDFSKKAGDMSKAKGGSMGYAKGGEVSSKADMKQDKKTAAVAVHKHEKNMHKGEPLTKLAKGGKVNEKSTGESYPSRAAMEKHESLETPRMQREELLQKTTVRGASPARGPAGLPARRGVPVAPTAPLIALKKGGAVPKAGAYKMPKVMNEFKSGELHSGSKKGPVVTNPKQAVAIAMSEARKAGKK